MFSQAEKLYRLGKKSDLGCDSFGCLEHDSIIRTSVWESMVLTGRDGWICHFRHDATPHEWGGSVIHPLQEPFVRREVVVELAQQVVVQHGLPVLADDRPVPPRRFDLPAGNGFDRPGEGAHDGVWRAAGAEHDIDRGGRS